MVVTRTPITPLHSFIRKAPKFEFSNTLEDPIEIEGEEDNTFRKGSSEDEEYDEEEKEESRAD